MYYFGSIKNRMPPVDFNEKRPGITPTRYVFRTKHRSKKPVVLRYGIIGLLNAGRRMSPRLRFVSDYTKSPNFVAFQGVKSRNVTVPPWGVDPYPIPQSKAGKAIAVRYVSGSLIPRIDKIPR